MRLFVFEGTVAEIAVAYETLNAKADGRAGAATAPMVSAEEPEAKPGGHVNLAQAHAILTRRRLSPEQRTVLKILVTQHPKLVSAIELREATNYTKPQFSGLMGAFGRRVSHTQGVEEGTEFFRWEWDEKQNEYLYGLPDSVVEAMKTAGL
jgi:hypothetical protein